MNKNFHLFIVEDDSDITEILRDNLNREGYKTTAHIDGAEALDAIIKLLPDLIILDLNLPGMSGFEVCKYIRSNDSTSEIPIIMLTARGEEIDKIIGFEAGADDYVTKPFSPRELLARVKVLLKRTKKTEFNVFKQNDLKINFATHQVFRKSKQVDLTPIQFKLLKLLIKSEGKALSRQMLLDTIWGDDYYGDPRTVDVHITRLREKIDKKNNLILTVKGVGYRWNIE
ncbi:MAG: DNA-binding response regulator [Calditrichaeota bacterium]|nr:MAG: DNA-binding response regulator [Calditrichota bacterium]MBL1207830.1 DNA-binding response regulator [Calditrichota bacterium]NOG47664.1 response regulator transcription factor [Calditrichota bacterium]